MTIVPIFHSTGGKYPTTYVTYIPVFIPDRYWVKTTRPATSYHYWWGGKRKKPLDYDYIEDFQVTVIEYSQYQVGSPYDVHYSCNDEVKTNPKKKSW